MEAPSNFKHLQKKIIAMANVFPTLQTVETWLNHSLKNAVPEQSLAVNMLMGPHVFWSLWGEMICKISPLLKFEILGVFVNTLTADDNYPLWTMIVIANVFSKLQTVKDFVKQLSGRRRFRTSFDSQHVNGCQTLMKSAWEPFYCIFWSLRGKMTWKISPLLNFEILGLFVNTLTADDKYSVPDCDHLQFPIQRQLL